MIVIDHYASVVLVANEACNRFIFSGYDAGYPTEVFRGAVQLLGGNGEKNDASPKDLLERELKEEFDCNIIGKEYAPASDILVILQQILTNASPHQDFLIQDPALRPLKPCRKLESLVSSYVAIVKPEILDLVEYNLRQGRKFVSEGDLNYVSIDELMYGKKLLAWSAPAIVGQMIGVKLPNHFMGQAIPIGQVRDSFDAYAEFKCVVGVGTSQEHTL